MVASKSLAGLPLAGGRGGIEEQEQARRLAAAQGASRRAFIRPGRTLQRCRGMEPSPSGGNRRLSLHRPQARVAEGLLPAVDLLRRIGPKLAERHWGRLNVRIPAVTHGMEGPGGLGIHTRMPRMARVATMHHVIRAAQRGHPGRRRRASHAGPEREVDPGSMRRLGNRPNVTQRGRLITYQVIAAAAVGNIAAAGHEIRLRGIAGTTPVAAASIAATTSETPAREVATSTAMKATSTSVKATPSAMKATAVETATAASVRATAAAS